MTDINHKINPYIFLTVFFNYDHLSFLLSPFLKEKKRQLNNNLSLKEFNYVKKSFKNQIKNYKKSFLQSIMI